MGLRARSGMVTVAVATARRTMCVAPKRVRRVSCVPTKSRARLMESDASLVHQRLQSFYEIARDGHDPFLAPLAAQENLRSWAIQLEIASIHADGFRNARAGARQEKQKRPIAPAARRLLIRRIDQSINLVSGQMMRDFDVRSFKRDSENALGDSQRRGVVRRHMMEKGSDRRQARVSRLNRVLALHFKLVQESKDKVSIKIRDAQCGWLTPGSFGDE